MKIKTLILLLLACSLQSCSWQENFVITNQTTSGIVIEYEVELPTNGFSIFNDQPVYHKLNSDGTISWEETTNSNDVDTAKLSFKILLPPGNGLIIGELSNDHYKSANQYFINGRHFNLKNLKIQNGKTLTEITLHNFDIYFKKQDNLIICRVN